MSADDERERVAARLQDGVSDRLAALATRLDAVMVRVADAGVQRVIGRAAAELAELAAGVRAIIVDLQRGDDDPDSVVGRIRTLALAAGQSLGCTPRLTLDGPLDDLGAADPALADDAVRVVEEALANAVRHSYAGNLDVAVVLTGATGGTLSVEVRDDGVGPRDEPPDGEPATTGGLAELRGLATARCGGFTVEPNDPLGTRLHWSVPTRTPS